MRVFLQTRVNKPIAVYDTDAPQAAHGKTTAGKFILNVLKPYAYVEEGGTILYEYNKPYPDKSAQWQFLIAVIGAAAIIGGSSLIFGLGRITKK